MLLVCDRFYIKVKKPRRFWWDANIKDANVELYQIARYSYREGHLGGTIEIEYPASEVKYEPHYMSSSWGYGFDIDTYIPSGLYLAKITRKGKEILRPITVEAKQTQTITINWDE